MAYMRNRHPNRTSEETEKRVCEEFAVNKNMNKLARDFQISRQTVYALLARNGLITRNLKPKPTPKEKLPLDEQAFDIVTDESAYWVGFIMADGCVTENKYSRVLSIGISIVDINHIVKYKSFLKSGHKIVISNSGGFANRKPIAQLAIASFPLVESLEKYGVLRRKTFDAKVLLLEKNRDFWRGLIDGDGCMYLTNGLPFISVAGSFDLMNQFRDYVRDLCPECEANVAAHGKIWSFSTAGVYAAKIVRTLYSDCKVALDRKEVIAKAIMDLPPIRVRRKWRELTAEVIENLYSDLGSWKKVAEHLGVSGPNLYLLRKRRNSK